MSRSNPTENGIANPSTRWFEWHGEIGAIRYFDKDAKKNIDVALPFSFLLLDQLGSVRGWHDASESGIYSNEVKDTRQEVMIVKAFKGGVLVEGVYSEIKDRVNTLGASFHANCYLAYKDAHGDLQIGCLRLKGAALGAWMEFGKLNRSALHDKAIQIHAFKEGKKGRIVFRVPIFKAVDVSAETHQVAVGMDVQLQTFLKSYLKRTKRDQVETPTLMPPDDFVVNGDHELGAPSVADDDIPF